MSRKNKIWVFASSAVGVLLLAGTAQLYFGALPADRAGFASIALFVLAALLLALLSFAAALALRSFYERFDAVFDVACNLLAIIGVASLTTAELEPPQKHLLVGALLLFVCLTVCFFHYLGAYSSQEKRFRSEQNAALRGEAESRRLFEESRRGEHGKWKESFCLTAECETIRPDEMEGNSRRIDSGAAGLYAVERNEELDSVLRQFMHDGSKDRCRVLFLTGPHASGKSTALLDAIHNQLNGLAQGFEIPVYVDLYDWLCGTKLERDETMLRQVCDLHKRVISGQKEKLRRDLLKKMFQVYYDEESFSELICAGSKTRLLFVFDGLEKVVGGVADEERKETARDLLLSLYDLIGERRCIISFVGSEALVGYELAMTSADKRPCQVVTITGARRERRDAEKAALAALPYDYRRAILSNVTLTRIWEAEKGEKTIWTRYELLERFLSKKINSTLEKMGLRADWPDRGGAKKRSDPADFCLDALSGLLCENAKESLSPYMSLSKESFDSERAPADELLMILDNADLISERSDGKIYVPNMLIYEYLVTRAIRKRFKDSGKAADYLRAQFDGAPVARGETFLIDILAMLSELDEHPEPFLDLLAGTEEETETESLLCLAERISAPKKSGLFDREEFFALLKSCAAEDEGFPVRKERRLMMAVRAFHLLSEDRQEELYEKLNGAVFSASSLELRREWLRTLSGLPKAAQAAALDETQKKLIKEYELKKEYDRFLLEEFPYYFIEDERGWDEGKALPDCCRGRLEEREREHFFTHVLYGLVIGALLVYVICLLCAPRAFGFERRLSAPWCLCMFVKLLGLVLGGGSAIAWVRQWRKPVYVFGQALFSVSKMFTIEEFLLQFLASFSKRGKARKPDEDLVVLLIDWLSNRPSIVLLGASVCALFHLPIGRIFAVLVCLAVCLLLIPLSTYRYVRAYPSSSHRGLALLLLPYLFLGLFNGFFVPSAVVLLLILGMAGYMLLRFSRDEAKMIWGVIGEEKKHGTEGPYLGALRERLQTLGISAAAQLRLLYVAKLFSGAQLREALSPTEKADLPQREEELLREAKDGKVYDMLRGLFREAGS